MDWAASIILLIGIGYQYQQLGQTNNQVVSIGNEKEKLSKEIQLLEQKNKTTENSLAVVRDEKNTIVALSGQAVNPKSFAKVY